MSCYNDLVIFSPDSFRKLNAYPVSKLRSYLTFLKTLISMIGYNAAFFSVLLFHCHKLASCNLRTAVYTCYEKLLLSLVLICCVMHYICKPCKLLPIPPGICRLLSICSIGKRTVCFSSYRPYLSHSHFATPSPGVRNLLSISA